jgi:hypothetical protein
LMDIVKIHLNHRLTINGLRRWGCLVEANQKN